MNTCISNTSGFLYKHFVKRVLFQVDPELVHTQMVHFGELCGKLPPILNLFKNIYSYADPGLNQNIAGIQFTNPIGLAAGFDYEARLTLTLASMGFGFGTVGTITNMPYGGNPRPMLGRLPKSRSLMVNKGFKNQGAKVVAQKLGKLTFPYPVGVSIGRTNSLTLKNQKQSIADILAAYQLFEQSNVNHAYYELNISCPNLLGDITFYPPRNLSDLLIEVKKLKLKKPLFIKMPIEKSDAEFLAMLEVLVKFPVAGIIIGNLQKNRIDSSLDPNEVAKFTKGYFSGKPCWSRSNELISLTYKRYKKNLIIVG